MLNILIILLMMGFSFYAWSFIHEMSHILMAKKRVGLEWFKLKLYPHMHNGSLRWAACEYMPKKPLTPPDVFAISLAPRIPDIVAVFMMMMIASQYLNSWADLAWLIFWGGGVVDLITGSIGRSPDSDLQKAAAAEPNSTSPKKLRTAGLMLAGFSIVTSLLSIFY